MSGFQRHVSLTTTAFMSVLHPARVSTWEEYAHGRRANRDLCSSLAIMGGPCPSLSNSAEGSFSFRVSINVHYDHERYTIQRV